MKRLKVKRVNIKRLKALYLILSCIITVTLSGCGLSSNTTSRTRRLSAKTTSAREGRLETSKKVLECLSASDADGLKALFSKKTQNLEDTDKQILAAFDFFEGKVTSFDEHILGSENEHIDHGRQTLLAWTWKINDVVTDEGGKYTLLIYQDVINEGDKDMEGIPMMKIMNDEDDEVVIGYSWHGYYKNGSDMSNNIVRIFDNRDLQGLKAMFCANTRELADIDQQIQNAFDFFDGKPTYGKVSDFLGKETYNGKHSYKVHVKEHETVKDSQPTYATIEVTIDNIETDTRKIYKIEFDATLISSDDKNTEGISHMIITSDDGSMCVIGNNADQ